MLGGGTHRHVPRGGQALDPDPVPQGGQEAGDLAVGVEDGDVAAHAAGVPHGVQAVHRGAPLHQGGAVRLGQDLGQVDVVGLRDRIGLRVVRGGRQRRRLGVVGLRVPGDRRGQRVLPHLLGVAQGGVRRHRPGPGARGAVHAHHAHRVETGAAQRPHQRDAVRPVVLHPQDVAHDESDGASEQDRQDRPGQGQGAAQHGQAHDDPHAHPAVAHRRHGPALAGAGEQTGQGRVGRRDAQLGRSGAGDRQAGEQRGRGPGAQRDVGRHAEQPAADGPQSRLNGAAPRAPQDPSQQDGHGDDEGGQALNGLEGEDQDLAQDHGEDVLHVLGDAGGRLVGVDRQDEHGQGADRGQGQVEQVLDAAQAPGRGIDQKGVGADRRRRARCAHDDGGDADGGEPDRRCRGNGCGDVGRLRGRCIAHARESTVCSFRVDSTPDSRDRRKSHERPAETAHEAHTYPQAVDGGAVRRPRGNRRRAKGLARDSPGANRPERVIPPWYRAHVAMTLRLTREDERILAELAEADGISRQEATVRAIREAAARRGHDRRVGEASARARARYADVLDRLGR